MKSSFSQEDLESKLQAYLNEFYHQRIVPLEKEIIRLGGKLDFEGNQNNVNLIINRFLPKNPFKESRENIHYWEDENSYYYRFFKFLFEYCLEKELITIKKPLYTYKETFSYWMWVFGCIDELNKELNLVLSVDEQKIVSPIEWQGQKNICIYLVDYLDKKRYIQSRKPNELIKEHFLPNSTIETIANTKTKFRWNKGDKEFDNMPLKSIELDKFLSELSMSLK